MGTWEGSIVGKAVDGRKFEERGEKKRRSKDKEYMALSQAKLELRKSNGLPNN